MMLLASSDHNILVVHFIILDFLKALIGYGFVNFKLHRVYTALKKAFAYVVKDALEIIFIADVIRRLAPHFILVAVLIYVKYCVRLGQVHREVLFCVFRVFLFINNYSFVGVLNLLACDIAVR